MNGAVKSSASNEVKGRINGLPSVDKTLSKEGHSADAKVTGEALDARVKKADIVDNLTTDDAEKPLSAKQGMELKKQIDALAASLGS